MTDMESAYENVLGKIFYAAAMIDGIIKEHEVIRLNQLLHEDWRSSENVILEGFCTCINTGYVAQDIFSDIEKYKKKHSYSFPDQEIEKIMKTAYSIVNAYSATNKSELIFISKLRNTLEA